MITKFELYQADKPWLCLSLMLETGGGRKSGGHAGLTGGEAESQRDLAFSCAALCRAR
jgi:hypothetical protein